MQKHKWISTFYYISFLYDAILGVAFMVAWPRIFAWNNVTPPNHPGYIQFPALLLIVFALMFLAVARAPEANRNLIPYGFLFKVSYCAVVFRHWFFDGIPWMWKPFAVADVIFAVLFLWTYIYLRPKPKSAPVRHVI